MHPEKETADPVGSRSAAEESAEHTEFYRTPRQKKTGRTRYLRIFPERATFLLDRLDDKQFVAAFRLTLEFVIRNGNIADDDRTLARATKLPVKAWADLKALLIEVGMGRVEAGRWVDDDQQTSLDLQNALTDRQRATALSRWGKRNA